jgi:hypothetical protein
MRCCSGELALVKPVSMTCEVLLSHTCHLHRFVQCFANDLGLMLNEGPFATASMIALLVLIVSLLLLKSSEKDPGHLIRTDRDRNLL